MIKLNKILQDAVVIVDGMNEFYKNYYKLRMSIGENVAGFYGTIRSVLSYRKLGRKVIVVWEGSSSKRKQENKDYKANRTSKNKQFYEQIADCKEFLANFVVQYQVSEYESDDMLATIAWSNDKKGKKSIIVTNDDDLHQVINENISVYCSSKKIMWNLKNLKYHIDASKLVLLWALEGDASDNIFGIKGIRKKEELVEKYFEWDKNEDLKIVLDNFVFELEGHNEKAAKVIKENYYKILNNMNLIRLRVVPKENYAKIEKSIEPGFLIKKHNCPSLLNYLEGELING
jgi:5'-3' exonuclease